MLSPITFMMSPQASVTQKCSEKALPEASSCLQPLQKDTVTFTNKYALVAKKVSEKIKPQVGLSLSGIVNKGKDIILHGIRSDVPVVAVNAKARALDPLILLSKGL